jgi:hypothetical protein
LVGMGSTCELILENPCIRVFPPLALSNRLQCPSLSKRPWSLRMCTCRHCWLSGSAMSHLLCIDRKVGGRELTGRGTSPYDTDLSTNALPCMRCSSHQQAAVSAHLYNSRLRLTIVELASSTHIALPIHSQNVAQADSVERRL